MPRDLAPGLALLAAPPREDARDALCGAASLAALASGARVGTGSIRRAAQLRAARDDLEVTGLRGNIDTRLRRLAEGRFDAIVLALAGLRRLGRAAEAGATLPIERFVPAPGQGLLELSKYGGIFVQTEDELAAVSYALGFSYAGHLAVTGSSGPGLSLKMEALGWGTMAEIPLIVINVQRGGPSTGMPTNVEQSDLLQALFGSHGDCPRVVLAPRNVEECFYVALEAARIARKFSTPVIILSDQGLSSRIEAFDEPDLASLMKDPKPDLSERGTDFKPYPLDRITRHAAPGSRIASGKYPTVSGLEHDELGHPSGNSWMHQRMTEKRREKLKALGAELPVPEVYGDAEGDVLLVGWGSTWGPIKEAVGRLRASGTKAGQLHLMHLNPMPPGLEGIFKRYRHVLVVEMNDQGLYGYGQMATLLRAQLAMPHIASVAKTDGLTFKVNEIVVGVNKRVDLNRPGITA